MCLLSYYPPGVMPHKERIRQGARVNADGCGFAIATSDGLLVQHGAESDELGLHITDTFCELRSRYPDGPALFHSRLITAGSSGAMNLHPFWFNDTSVVAHNGHLFDVPEGDLRSDTFIFAREILPPMAKYGTMDQIERYLGQHNKAVIITDGGQGYLLNGDAGIWIQGEWHSGSDFLPPGPSSGDPSWAVGMEYKEAHQLYRKLGSAVLSLESDRHRKAHGRVIREFQQLRGDLVIATTMHTGLTRENYHQD